MILDIGEGSNDLSYVKKITYTGFYGIDSDNLGLTSVIETALYVSMLSDIEVIASVTLKVTPSKDQNDNYLKSKVDTDEEEFNNAYLNFRTKSSYALIQATLCHATKSLKVKNVSSFFAMSGVVIQTPKSFITLLDYSVSVLGPFLKNNEVYKKYIDNDFMKYHTTYSSSGALIIKASEFLGSYSKFFFTAEEIIVANNSKEALYDYDKSVLISDKAIYTAAAVLEACKKYPENWYQGNRAKSDAPIAAYSLVLYMAKRYFELMTSVDIIDSASTVDLLFSKCIEGNLCAPDERAVIDSNNMTAIDKIADKVKGKYVKDAFSESITIESVKRDLVKMGKLNEVDIAISVIKE